jgi:CxxC motif-containing protein (DUF1111 family)
MRLYTIAAVTALSAMVMACGGAKNESSSEAPVGAAPPPSAPAPGPSAPVPAPVPSPAAPAPAPDVPVGPAPAPVAEVPNSPQPGTAVAAPPGLGAADYVPLYTSATQVVEQTQYKEADGTLVTLLGFRPTPRHAKEGGEEWTNPVDAGPGSYLAFPPFYFQNRTFGLVIRDEVPAGRQKITAYLKPNRGTLINNSFQAFRRLDPGVIEYGWKLGVGYRNPADGSERCNPTDRIDEMCVATTIISDYWRFADEKQYQGNTTRADNKLVVGDKIEMTAGVFLDHVPGSAIALIDGGQSRDYSLEQMYVVGRGFVPWYGIAPRLDTHPLPDQTLLGGLASVSYNYSEEPHRLLQQSATNIGPANMQRFVEGRRLFHTSFLDGRHTEAPDVNPVFTAHANQLGQRFNAERCFGCHIFNGRSKPAVAGSVLDTYVILTAKAGSTGTHVVPDDTYGLAIRQQTRQAGAPDYAVSVASFDTQVRTLPDGEQVEMRKPVYAFKGPVPAQFSVRQAPQVAGVGLIEAVDEAAILALADPDDRNGDGVRGIPNWSTNPETGQRNLGRFGWKAGKGSVRQQTAGAALLDMGVTTPVHKTESCARAAADCGTSTATPAISHKELERLTAYMQLLGVPAQRSLASGYTDGTVTPPEHQIDVQGVERGRQLFAQAACTSCHTPEMRTGANHPFFELRNQVIRPYSNFLLHDLGPEMADSYAEGQASPGMWRTQPLWGLGSLKYTQNRRKNGEPDGTADPQSVRYLHDGRARTLMEAIAWHGGEAAGSRSKFEALSKADRAALIVFLESL